MYVLYSYETLNSVLINVLSGFVIDSLCGLLLNVLSGTVIGGLSGLLLNVLSVALNKIYNILELTYLLFMILMFGLVSPSWNIYVGSLFEAMPQNGSTSDTVLPLSL